MPRKKYKNIPQGYSAEILFCSRVCHGETCWFCTSTWHVGAQAGRDPVHGLLFCYTFLWIENFLKK